MRAVTPRTRTAARWAAIPIGLLASAGLVWQASYAAFSATTANPGNSWATGSVALSNDSSNTAMFSASNLKPGSTGQKCIAVTSTGTLASTVRLYATGETATKSLDSYVDLRVEEGAGGGFSSCTGFVAGTNPGQVYNGTLAGFAATYTNFGTGFGTFAPTGAGSQTETYRITYTIDAATPNTAQGGTASTGFTWEADNS